MRGSSAAVVSRHVSLEAVVILCVCVCNRQRVTDKLFVSGVSKVFELLHDPQRSSRSSNNESISARGRSVPPVRHNHTFVEDLEDPFVRRYLGPLSTSVQHRLHGSIFGFVHIIHFHLQHCHEGYFPRCIVR